ncbi:hypothetical protein WN944_014949 [Citrus x changshan-huyou]|uniref:Protein FAR1-RELATED SEQUENCE n=1 Tax=Citrus x changshan-huyou TaxID=2935761 RepID=A0AAP0M6K6_9ROSI
MDASLDGAISDDSLSLAACTFNSTSSNQFESLLPNLEANTQPPNSDHTFSSYASGDRLSEYDVIGRVFSSIEEAETFYFDYAKSIGFSVRKNIMRTNVQGQVTVRRWVCSKEGKRSKKYLELPDRKKTAKPLTRELCRAAFCIRFDHRKGVWVACEWVDTHTHVLVPAVQVAMRMLGSQEMTCPIVNMRAVESKYYKLTQKHSFRFCVENKIWTPDSITSILLILKAGYPTHFGVTLSFDSTYRTDAYNKPLMLFVGLNHHMRSTVFGFVLLSSETEDKYIWLLRTFLSAMNGKMHVSIVTDGDRAMRNAIRTVFPDASHRLCCWHLERNDTANISDPNFTSAFKDVMLNYMADDEFQFKWDQMIGKFHLTNNEWIKKLYANRHMWAETFLRHNFFGGLRSNQRCESMNAYINQYVGGKLMLFEFVMQMEFLISRLRYKEAEDDHHSCQTMPVLITHLQKHYEQQAATIYTRTVFNRVLKELREDGLLYISNCMSDVGRRIYVIKKFKLEDRSWRVVFHEADSKLVNVGVIFNLPALSLALDILSFLQVASLKNLTGTNFEDWRESILFYLSTLNRDLALRVDEPAKPTDKSTAAEKAEWAAWDESNRHCLDTMKYTIDRTTRDSIPACDKAKDYLAAVGRTFKKVDKAEKGNYLRLLANTQYDGVSGVREHILKMTSYHKKLKDMDVNLPDDYLVFQILESLPPQFGNLRSQYNTQRDTWNITELTAYVVQEEESLKKGKSHTVMVATTQKSGSVKKCSSKGSNKFFKKKKFGKKTSRGNSSTNSGSTSENFKGKCHFCKKPGHKRAECRGFKAWLEKKGIHVAFVGFESNLVDVPSDTWWLDTGATINITNSL